MPLRKWVNSANNAIEGILYAAKTQRHLRYHLYAAVTVLIFSYVLGVQRHDFLIIAATVIMVLFAELINTAIEFLVDMVSPEYNEKARIAKDVAAGAVLTTAFGASIIGYIILFPYVHSAFDSGIYVAKHSPNEIALISIIIVVILVVMLKAHYGTGHPLRGGMPSGHSAIAFSLWLALTFMTESFPVSLIVFVLAAIIAQSRVAIKAHTPAEVVMGALLGMGITLSLFFIFR